MKMIISGVFIILFFIKSGCAVTESEVCQMRLSKEEVVRLSNVKAVELGYDVGNMDVDFDEKNTAWNEYISKGPFLESNPELKNKLQGKDHWAIYYRPRVVQFGGDLWIFVDKNSGEIITVIEGK